jgi:uncharacterized protein (TIGR00251 family)
MKVKAFVKIGRGQGLLGWDGERLTVRIDAPPIDGAANTKLIEVMSEWLGVSKSQVQIAKGHTARYKTLEVDITPELFNRLVNSLPQLPKQGTLL